MATTQTRDSYADMADSFDGTADQALAGVFQPLEQLSPSVYVGATLGSIALAIALYLSGRKDSGIFVGLWAPTFLNLGLYLKQLRPSRQ